MRFMSWAASALLLAVCGSAQAAEEPIIEFHILSQPLRDALGVFGKQAHFEVVYSIPDNVQLNRAPAVIGKFTVSQAMSMLIAGSGGDYRKVTDDMIVFRIPQKGSSTAPPLPQHDLTTVR